MFYEGGGCVSTFILKGASHTIVYSEMPLNLPVQLSGLLIH